MSKPTRTEEEIMTLWGASLEQQYLSSGNPGSPSNNCEGGNDHQDFPEDPWRRSSSPALSQIGSSFSMPTENVSDMEGDIEARSTATVSGSFEEEHQYYVDGLLIDLGIPVPDVVHLDESTREKINEECELAAMGCSLSDKLTSDDISSEPEVLLPPPKLARPVVITSADRCVTPQVNNLRRNSKFPVSPGVISKSSEVYHYTYETDLHVPSSPVPAFVVVPHSGVASRVTVTPKGTAVQSAELHVRRKRNRSFSKNACLFLLASILILSLVTLAAGIVKAKFDTPQIPTTETSPPTVTSPTGVPVLVTPEPSPYDNATPTMQPVIPNEDFTISFPDLGGGVVAREETASPTSSDYIPPTPSPRTRRPTIAPTFLPSSLPSSEDDLNNNTFSYNATEFGNETTTMRTYIRRLITSASPSTNLTFLDPSSDQSRALEWIVADQLLTDPILPKSRILQRFALATLFFSTHGANWTNSTRWLTSSHECDWYHPRTNYVCTESGIMHTLQMDGNGLSGTLPPELALMSFRGIFLRDNNISGTIPTELATLEKLEHLQLTNNALEGTFPTEFGNVANLTVIGIGRNFLNGTLPSELGLLNSLDTLGIEGNSFGGTIPSELGSIDSLRFVSLRMNDLSGPIPSELGRLTRLAILEVDSNDLSGNVPVEICGLRNTTLSRLLVDCDRLVCTPSCCDNC